MSKETKETTTTGPRAVELFRRVSLLLFGLLLGLLAGEVLVRQAGLQTFAGATHPMDLGPDPLSVMELDDELGFMPRIGTLFRSSLCIVVTTVKSVRIMSS